MPKTKISEFSSTPASNTDIDSINLAEGCAPSGINDAIRELMAQLKDWQSGTSNDPYVVGSSGSLTLNQGTANGVAYLNGSKVVTSGSALTFDGTNLGVGTATVSDFSGTVLAINAASGSAARIKLTNSSSGTTSSDGGGITYDTSFNLTLLNRESSGSIIFSPDSATEAMRLTSTGLGIGTSSPSYKLDVSGTFRTTGIAYLGDATTTLIASIGNSASSGVKIVQFQRASGTGDNVNIQGINTGIGAADIGMQVSGGNVGIGTSSPTAKLHVSGDAIANTFKLIANTTVSASDATIFRPADNTMAFSTNGAERCRIDSSGNLLVGTTSQLGGGSYGNNQIQASVGDGGKAALVVYNSNASDGAPALNAIKNSATTTSSQRFIQFYADAGATAMGGIVGNGASNAQFASISDVREKTNITPISGSLEKIVALKPVEFDWILNGEHCPAGFVAQDVEQVFPEFVIENMANEGQESRKGLTGGMTGGIVAHLVKAIQELKAEFDAYKASHP